MRQGERLQPSSTEKKAECALRDCGSSSRARRKIVATTLLATFLSSTGCFTQSLYSGSDAARLEARGVDIATIDGETVSVHSSAIELKPGEHELHGNTTAGGLLGPADKNVQHTIRMLLKAGRTYYAKGSSAYGYCIWVQDAETREVVSEDRKGCGVLKMGDKGPPD